jgi:hypothetical protein
LYGVICSRWYLEYYRTTINWLHNIKGATTCWKPQGYSKNRVFSWLEGFICIYCEEPKILGFPTIIIMLFGPFSSLQPKCYCCGPSCAYVEMGYLPQHFYSQVEPSI